MNRLTTRNGLGYKNSLTTSTDGKKNEQTGKLDGWTGIKDGLIDNMATARI